MKMDSIKRDGKNISVIDIINLKKELIKFKHKKVKVVNKNLTSKTTYY